MAEVVLGVKAAGGGYQEVAGGGYARAGEMGQFKDFGPAAATWGVVRAYGVTGEAGAVAWTPLAAPVVVQAGQAATLDLATGALSVTAPPGESPDRRVAVTARPRDTRLTGR